MSTPLMDISQAFAAHLRRRREQLGMTTRTLAETMHQNGFPWHHATVYQVETGRRPLKLNEAWFLAHHLGMPLIDDPALPALYDKTLVADLDDARKRIDELEQEVEKLTRSRETMIRRIEQAMGRRT